MQAARGQDAGEAAEAKARAAAEAAARHSYGKLVAYLAARSRDVAGAEDALSEAFAAALAQWPRDGVPQKPEAWLMSVARRRGIDAVRRRQTTVDGPRASRTHRRGGGSRAGKPRRYPRRASQADVCLRAS